MGTGQPIEIDISYTAIGVLPRTVLRVYVQNKNVSVNPSGWIEELTRVVFLDPAGQKPALLDFQTAPGPVSLQAGDAKKAVIRQSRCLTEIRARVKG